MRCATTEELSPLEEIIGQERAVKALRFGLGIEQLGFNIYVAGYPGTGRTTAVKDFLEEIAKKKQVPSDWCYVNNFKNSYEPKAIRLPPGKVKDFQTDLSNLINEAQRALPKAFESEEYATKRESIIKAIGEERNELFSQLSKRAQEEGFVIQTGPTGLLVIPVVKGKPLNEREFNALSPLIRDEILKRREKLDADLSSVIRQFRALEGKAKDEIENLNREVALYAIGHLFADLKEKYKEFHDVTTYLDEVQNDILENLAQFLKPEAAKAPPVPFPIPWMKELPLKKYEVNVIVDNSDLKGAPVVVELNPTYQNIFGRIEKEAQFGVLTTDFTMIRPGSLHKANGGYLVLPVEELLQNIFSWDGLKRALKNKQVAVEEAGERLGFITTKGLRPEPIPLSIKVVLIGNPLLYQMLYSMDKDFKELFKVKADFDTTMDRTQENMQKYAAFICTFCGKENLRHLEASAVAKTIEYASRLAEDQEKLSTRFADIADIVREANFYALQENSEYVTADHVKKAIEEKIYRSNLIQKKIQEMMERNILLIDTDGEIVGQVNGLTVMSLGDFSFGAPSRVTASIGLGREGIIDIQREAKLAGPIHTKGVLILSGYLAEKYAQDKPLSLSARLVFEQSYGMVEGDSASSTELYGILSALSGIPIKQNIAVTGSVNQKGEVQAIGGVNEKIEGFFEVCKTKGLTGIQGVLIPESNVENLMLKEEVVDAVKAGKFHIYPVKTIDEGIEILAGVKAGARRPDGTFEEGTVNYRVDKRLKEMAEKIKEFPEFVVGGRKKE
ncbi:MAG: AAA family ATPase [Candidatus Bathyarchaeota archaeon]|nr:AAA family ATPase [Candidatus Bathyarchaeota archaeon]MDH5635174.1 AAA family ATPase [Candidatus Bathyarchaeota archaeon]